MDPRAFIRSFIETHEGGLSLDPKDTGNWHKGILVGSKYGVTGDTLAAHRKVPRVTPEEMAALTLDEAVEIGYSRYYLLPGFSILPWDPVVASVLDMAWGAGPKQAIKLLQRMIGAGDDGVLGPATARAYKVYVSAVGPELAAKEYAEARGDYYDLIIQRRPSNGKFRKGWRNRTSSFLPGTSFWAAFTSASTVRNA